MAKEIPKLMLGNFLGARLYAKFETDTYFM